MSEPKGKYVREIFKHAEMDIVTIGNHELYKPESASNDYAIMRPHYGVCISRSHPHAKESR